MRTPLSSRLLIGVFGFVNRLIAWHRLPRWLGILNLLAFRDELRAKNLVDTSDHTIPSRTKGVPPEQLIRLCPCARFVTARASEGTCNDLTDPQMGAAHYRLGRNVPLKNAWPEAEPGLLEPSPRLISNRLLKRTEFVPATSLNLLAAAWIQFMTHDWFHHTTPSPGNEFKVPLDTNDTWPRPEMRVRRTPADPTRDPADKATYPPTYVNDGSHWWDGSQIYGNNESETDALRCSDDEGKGKLRLSRDRLLPIDPGTQREQSGLIDNWWIGLSLLHTLFAQEHDAIADRLNLAYPYWTGEKIFDTARLITCALMAKIHTVEWTPGILAHPVLDIAMNANWWGLAGEKITRLFGRISGSELLSGIPGSGVEHHGCPYSLTEEFVAVYRLHSLLPESLRFHRCSDGSLVREVPLLDVAEDKTRSALDGGLTLDDICYSFGIANPGALRLHNFPEFLRSLQRTAPDGEKLLLDLAAIDILRDRERGVPRYNEFRRLMHLKPARDFAGITSNPAWQRELREVYGDVERVDLLVGCLAEDLPRGFGFSDTQFRVFILMASRRIKSDRFFAEDFNENTYTPLGMDWIKNTTMSTILIRHFPGVAPALRGVKNAFAPWNRIEKAIGAAPVRP